MSGHAYASRIPLEFVARGSLPYRRTHGPTLDDECCCQKTRMKPVQVPRFVASRAVVQMALTGRLIASTEISNDGFDGPDRLYARFDRGSDHPPQAAELHATGCRDIHEEHASGASVALPSVIFNPTLPPGRSSKLFSISNSNRCPCVIASEPSILIFQRIVSLHGGHPRGVALVLAPQCNLKVERPHATQMLAWV